MKSYVTLLSTINYLPGVLALNESIRRTGANYPLVVALSPHIPPTIELSLRQAGMHVTTLPASINIANKLINGYQHWGNTFDKLHIFGLTKFSKLVYIDSDMLVLENIDELFEKPHLSAVASGQLENPAWYRLNSGLMVIEPEHGLPEKIAATLQDALLDLTSIGQSAIGDQDLINAYFSTWPTNLELHLNERYNIFQCHLDSYIEKHQFQLPSDSKNFYKTIKIVHFIGLMKPWMKGALIRHYVNLLKRGKSAKWENQVFMAYRKLIKESSTY